MINPRYVLLLSIIMLACFGFLLEDGIMRYTFINPDAVPRTRSYSNDDGTVSHFSSGPLQYKYQASSLEELYKLWPETRNMKLISNDKEYIKLHPTVEGVLLLILLLGGFIMFGMVAFSCCGDGGGGGEGYPIGN